MGFADEVAAETASTGSGTIGHMVQVLNALPAKERAEIVAYLDGMRRGGPSANVAAVLTKRAAKLNLGIEITPEMVSRFRRGSRNGLIT